MSRKTAETSTSPARRGKRGTVPPCPECRDREGVGLPMGSRLGVCHTCNAFRQAVRRETYNLLRDLHPDDYAACSIVAEEELAPRYIGRWEDRQRLAAQASLARSGS